jgi:hypothetical protein
VTDALLFKTKINSGWIVDDLELEGQIQGTTKIMGIWWTSLKMGHYNKYFLVMLRYHHQ